MNILPYTTTFDHRDTEIQLIAQRATTAHDPNLPVSPQTPQTNLKFSGCSFISDFVTYYEDEDGDVSPQPRVTKFRQEFREAFTSVGSNELFCQEKSHEIVAPAIKDLLVNATSRQEKRVATFALDKARDAFSTIPQGHNVVHLHIQVTAVIKNFYVRKVDVDWMICCSTRPDVDRMIRRLIHIPDRHLIDILYGGLIDKAELPMFPGHDLSTASPDPVGGMIPHSIDVDEVDNMIPTDDDMVPADEDEDFIPADEDDHMVPAEDSSIKSLEKKIVLTTDCGACSICLDEFSRGCEAVSLPCPHFFHEDCIKKWLKTSHYCPICRFEMPTC